MLQCACYSDISCPFLLVLYINDLSVLSDKLLAVLFDEDTAVLIDSTHLNSMITSFNCEVAKITELSIKANKIYCILYSIAQDENVHKQVILLGKTTLKQVTFNQVLGIILDGKLKRTYNIIILKIQLFNIFLALIKSLHFG